ncbi:MAG: hypothetical protein HYR55_15080 [Acidobacteria bacterium]|nr:hypothetical protein [Acidobacteriota bacterium]MBI3657662.1 hypothetical protein [Acidobacteriota bacterium]
MTDRRELFRQYMKDLVPELESGPKDHLSDEELVHYLHGELAATERERVQSHLVPCRQCRDALQDVQDFFEAPRADEVSLGAAPSEQQWQALQRHISSESNKATTSWGGLRLGWLSLDLRATWALAVGLILIIMAAGAWSFRLRRENQELMQQVQSDQRRRMDSLQQSAQENHRLQDRMAVLQQSYESQMAELRRPQLNPPIYDLYSSTAVARSGTGRRETVIKVPHGVRVFTLLLNGTGLPIHTEYAVEITDGAGHVFWRSGGLQRSRDGNFLILLNRTFLPEGSHQLKLYGQAAPREVTLAEYRLRLNYAQ